MSLRNIGIVYRKELVDSLRDRRTLVSMILIPFLLMPALTVGVGYVVARVVLRAMQEPSVVMVAGGSESPLALAALRKATIDDTGTPTALLMSPQAPTKLRKASAITFLEPTPDYVRQVSTKRIHAALEIPPGFDGALVGGELMTIRIYLRRGDIRSEIAAGRLEQALRSLRDATIRMRLGQRNIPEKLLAAFDIQKTTVSHSLLAGLTPYMVILLAMIGAMYPAMDLTAGEKERGTMETILCSPVARTDLVLGKFLVVLSTSLATAILTVLVMAVSFMFAKDALAGLPPDRIALFHISIDSKAALAIIAIVLPVCVFLSALQLAICLFAKSFKEAQSYLSPLMILIIFPSLGSMLPGIELNAKLAMIPILNASLATKEILSGSYQWGYITLTFLSSCFYAAIALAAAVWLFNREEVLFRS